MSANESVLPSLKRESVFPKLSSHPAFLSALSVYHTLKQAGYQSYFAGGSVRDLCLDKIPHDFDLASSATPEQVQALFPKTVTVGAQFGVVVVVKGDVATEVASFRADGVYIDGRRPDQVIFADPETDAFRRDFTINSLFWDPDQDLLVDYTGGRRDLQQRLIRAVGEPRQRFREDRLRLLRALRFVAQLDFNIEEETWRALLQEKSNLKVVSGERVRDELQKMFLADFFISKGVDILYRSQILLELWPSLKLAESQLRFKAVKSVTESWSVFFQVLLENGNDKLLLQQIGQDLKFSNSLTQQVFDYLFFWLQPELAFSWRKGQVLEALFNPLIHAGLSELLKSPTCCFSLQEKNEVNDWLKRFGSIKPVAVFSSQDFIVRATGKKLGLLLKWAYWLQLEFEFEAEFKIKSSQETTVLREKIEDRLKELESLGELV